MTSSTSTRSPSPRSPVSRRTTRGLHSSRLRDTIARRPPDRVTHFGGADAVSRSFGDGFVGMPDVQRLVTPSSPSDDTGWPGRSTSDREMATASPAGWPRSRLMTVRSPRAVVGRSLDSVSAADRRIARTDHHEARHGRQHSTEFGDGRVAARLVGARAAVAAPAATADRRRDVAPSAACRLVGAGAAQPDRGGTEPGPVHIPRRGSGTGRRRLQSRSQDWPRPARLQGQGSLRGRSLPRLRARAPAGRRREALSVASSPPVRRWRSTGCSSSRSASSARP